jgi:hypothetical protein
MNFLLWELWLALGDIENSERNIFTPSCHAVLCRVLFYTPHQFYVACCLQILHIVM